MSKHSITKSVQLRVNGKGVDALGKKARAKDAGLTLRRILGATVSKDDLAKMRNEAERRARRTERGLNTTPADA